MGSAAAAGTATGPARQAEFSRHQGQVGLRGGQVQLELRLGASEVTRLADDQMASRANRCSTTTRRARYSSYPALCCNARACCRRASWGWISTHRPVLPLDEMHWDRSGQVIHSDPSNWKACKRWTRPAPSVRFPAGTMVWVTCPRRTGATARRQVDDKVIFGKALPVGGGLAPGLPACGPRLRRPSGSRRGHRRRRPRPHPPAHRCWSRSPPPVPAPPDCPGAFPGNTFTAVINAVINWESVSTAIAALCPSKRRLLLL